MLYLTGGIVAIVLACKPGAGALRDMVLPREPDRCSCCG
jgi:hypothetical protein